MRHLLRGRMHCPPGPLRIGGRKAARLRVDRKTPALYFLQPELHAGQEEPTMEMVHEDAGMIDGSASAIAVSENAKRQILKQATEAVTRSSGPNFLDSPFLDSPFLDSAKRDKI
jgi:hypothetical protein